MAIAALLFAAAFSARAFADETKEVHGSGDAYAASGVAMAWAILRGADEASTQVVLRIVADPATYASMTAVGKNPFNGEERTLQAPTSLKAAIDIRVARAQFAEFPRTELRFFAASATPALVVYYLGVPDTTPEFADRTKLEAYLEDRIARARAAAGGKAP